MASFRPPPRPLRPPPHRPRPPRPRRRTAGSRPATGSPRAGRPRPPMGPRWTRLRLRRHFRLLRPRTPRSR
ncbi:hypothetical protein FCI23_25645 [Actinacidiphila oryziradicis]|uniref:Uncharacterized protein n=1 Tax=Actinacidiphila oryziradicis TaxID=2571141 RepID=A0A4U0T789_9ACTN|nr:hypothetical protein FCI23_25645 [Actinacidiphila oryziradicis]